MRKYAAGIIIKDNQILLMRRVNKEEEYYTLPGGGLEPGESSEENALREVREETSIVAKVNRLLYKITWDTGNENYYFLCDYLEGEPHLPNSSEEFERMQRESDQVYDPKWFATNMLSNIILYPLEIRDLLIEHLANGLPAQALELSLIAGERKLG